MHRSDPFGRQALALGGVEHPIAHEACQRVLVEVLQLAPAASAEMAARRNGVMRARLQRTVGEKRVAGRGVRRVAARRGDSVTPGGDADDLFGLAHRAAA